MDNEGVFTKEFIKNACFRLDESLRMVRLSLAKISEEQLWQKPNASLNSIGNLILHLCGNLKQYGIASLRGLEDLRERDAEFAITGGLSKEVLIEKLATIVEEVKHTFTILDSYRWVAVERVQGFELSGVGNAIHAVEHFSYHTGQIAFWVKLLNNEQLGFYDGVDLNILNDE